MVIMLITIGVHLFFLLKGVIGGVILKLKAKMIRYRSKKSAKKHVEYNYSEPSSDLESDKRGKKRSSRIEKQNQVSKQENMIQEIRILD